MTRLKKAEIEELEEIQKEELIELFKYYHLPSYSAHDIQVRYYEPKVTLLIRLDLNRIILKSQKNMLKNRRGKNFFQLNFLMNDISIHSYVLFLPSFFIFICFSNQFIYEFVYF